jgi:hypothetical protein
MGTSPGMLREAMLAAGYWIKTRRAVPGKPRAPSTRQFRTL